MLDAADDACLNSFAFAHRKLAGRDGAIMISLFEACESFIELWLLHIVVQCCVPKHIDVDWTKLREFLSEFNVFGRSCEQGVETVAKAKLERSHDLRDKFFVEVAAKCLKLDELCRLEIAKHKHESSLIERCHLN